ncbi:MAG: M23 family metallopeptidase [Gammaproteobacteria bacterium]|nr:MAG: M23 family metallopeptidase [Gammaproteobacteria bacterium]
MNPFASRTLTGFVGLLMAVGTQAGTLKLDREPLQGALIIGRTEPGATVTIDGSAVRVSNDGVFLLGFGRDAPSKARLSADFPDGSRTHRDLRVVQRSYDVQRVDGLPPSKVSPSEEDMVRIRHDIALVKKARSRDDPREDFLAGFEWPVKGRISGVYGSQRILNGKPRRPHFGVDVAAPVGTIVRAPADGVVTLSHGDMFFSGGTLIVDHGHGLSSSFLHLSAILVKEGDRIRQGDPIAKVGATGRVSGPHLDWRMNLLGNRLDPQLLVAPMAPQ